jgi:hypothetical protein
MDPEVRTYLIAAGLVVVALLGLVVVWKVAASFLRLFFWILILGFLLAAGWWLLYRQGLVPAPGWGSPSAPAPGATPQPAASIPGSHRAA